MRLPEEPAGLYLHVPFCGAICPYCDFSVRTGSAPERTRFAHLLEEEIRQAGPVDLAFDSVYFGGGTPSLLTLEDLGGIVRAIHAEFTIGSDACWSLEVNPEDVDRERVDGWRSIGFETITLGVQSLDAVELRWLGRRHSPAEAREAVHLAREAGFDTVGIDLIYAHPGSTIEAWEASLGEAVALPIDHLSCYELTIEEGTPFGARRDRGDLLELPEERRRSFFETTHRFLEEARFPAYEVSNFARSTAHRSRHNRKYWEHAAYLGLGPSAHSFRGGRRWWNHADYDRYRECIRSGLTPRAGGEDLRPSQLALERVMLGLRTVEGIDLDRFLDRYGVDLAGRNRSVIDRGLEDGSMRLEGRRLFLTRTGLVIADALAAEFDVGDDRPG